MQNATERIFYVGQPDFLWFRVARVEMGQRNRKSCTWPQLRELKNFKSGELEQRYKNESYA